MPERLLHLNQSEFGGNEKGQAYAGLVFTDTPRSPRMPAFPVACENISHGRGTPPRFPTSANMDAAGVGGHFICRFISDGEVFKGIKKWAAA